MESYLGHADLLTRQTYDVDFVIQNVGDREDVHGEYYVVAFIR